MPRSTMVLQSSTQYVCSCCAAAAARCLPSKCDGAVLVLQVDFRQVSSRVIHNTFDKSSLQDTLPAAETASKDKGRGSLDLAAAPADAVAVPAMTDVRLRRSSWASGFLKMSGMQAESMALCCFTKMCGSLVYMAPEVFKGNVYDEKCDVFSLAMVFCELMLGKSMARVLHLETYSDAFRCAEKVRHT